MSQTVHQTQPSVRQVPVPVEIVSLATAKPAPTTVHGSASATTSLNQPACVVDEWLSVAAQEKRHESVGLTRQEAAQFIQNCNFISLGSYCAVGRALQSVGLKGLAYPFDWVRCSSEGVIQCLGTNFQDFLTYSAAVKNEQTQETVYCGSKWGGSFWHHNPDSNQTKSDMARRIDRLLGRADVPASRTRVFVRAANSSSDVEQCSKLHEALRRALPQARIYLLVLADLQKTSGPVGIVGHDDFLLCRIHEGICPAGGQWTMQRQAEAYAQALAFAVRLWAGENGLASRVQMVQDLAGLSNLCDEFEGTDPASELWLPKRKQGSMSSSPLTPSPIWPASPRPTQAVDSASAPKPPSPICLTSPKPTQGAHVGSPLGVRQLDVSNLATQGSVQVPQGPTMLLSPMGATPKVLDSWRSASAGLAAPAQPVLLGRRFMAPMDVTGLLPQKQHMMMQSVPNGGDQTKLTYVTAS